MIVLGNFMIAVSGILGTIVSIFYILIIAAVVISWVSPDPRNPIVQFIYSATEPLFARVRAKLPPLGILDLSPIVVLLFLYFIDKFLVATLADYGAQWKMSAVGAVGF